MKGIGIKHSRVQWVKIQEGYKLWKLGCSQQTKLDPKQDQQKTRGARLTIMVVHEVKHEISVVGVQD